MTAAPLARVRTATALARDATSAQLVGIEVLARQAGVHPDLAGRLVRIGLLVPVGGTATAPRFSPDAAARLARAARLRRDLGLSYAGAVLACELLGRIEELEERLSRYEPPGKGER